MSGVEKQELKENSAMFALELKCPIIYLQGFYHKNWAVSFTRANI